ncbi:MAG: histidinol-phosphatase [Alphaproteobacteria bacterium]|nr:histidinol-phosphatase [Alphaproteobacteria bacterium]
MTVTPDRKDRQRGPTPDPHIKPFAERLADAARAETLPRFRAGAQIYNKAGMWFDPVTDADREAERAQRRLIEAMYPDHGILGEEFGETRPEASARWVLDPVDGTRAFVCGAATWATLIAHEINQSPVLGVIDQPFTDERWIGDGAACVYRRAGVEAPSRVSGCAELGKARITTTDPRSTAYFTRAEALAFEAVADAARLARFGFDAYGYALLALGEMDLVMEAGLQRHDYAALVPVIEGAGGVVTNWRGERPGADDRGEILAAGSAPLHAEALALIADVRRRG